MDEYKPLKRSASRSVVALPLQPVLALELAVSEEFGVARPLPHPLRQLRVERAVLIVLVDTSAQVVQVRVPRLVPGAYTRPLLSST